MKKWMVIVVLSLRLISVVAFAQNQIPTLQPSVDVRFNGISKCKTGPCIGDCMEIRNGIGILPVEFQIGRDLLNASGKVSIEDLKIATLKAVSTDHDKNGLIVAGEVEGPAYVLRQFFTENNMLQTQNIQILQLKLIATKVLNNSLVIKGEVYWSNNFNIKHSKDNLDFDVTQFENFKDSVCSNCSIEAAKPSRVWNMGANITVTARDRASFIAFYRRYANYTYASFTKSYTLDDSMWQNRFGAEVNYSVSGRSNVYKLMIFARDELLVNTRTFNAQSTREGEEPLKIGNRIDTYNLVSFGIKAIIR